MASDNTKTEAGGAKKSEPAAKNKTTSAEASPKAEAGDKAVTEKSSSAEGSPKAEAEAAVAAPSGYSRGEGQKPVSRAYKENWNAIFAKKGVKKNAKKKNR